MKNDAKIIRFLKTLLKRTTMLVAAIFGTTVSVITSTADPPEITILKSNGEIQWTDTNTTGHYTIEWKPSATADIWHSDWSPLTHILAVGGTYVAEIPMLFRVVHHRNTLTGANMVLVPGGGQPGGPQYGFYMGKYEVTVGEFVKFLNDVQENPNEPRNAFIHFSPTSPGIAWVGDGQTQGPTVFYIYGTYVTYVLQNPPGERYVVPSERVDHPIMSISWYAAVKYCNWLTVYEGAGLTDRCYTEGPTADDWRPANLTLPEWEDGFDAEEREEWLENYSGYRLPMANRLHDSCDTANEYNEFYKAAAWNGSTNTYYGFGRDTLDGQDANYKNSGDPWEGISWSTTPVGYYDGTDHFGEFATRSNENYYGIFDLSGNVSELMTGPGSPGSGLSAGRRGGGHDNVNASGLSTCTRGTQGRGQHYESVGFRVVLTAP